MKGIKYRYGFEIQNTKIYLVPLASLGLARQISVACKNDLKDENAKLGVQSQILVTRKAGLQFSG